jgi:hypothetical protein
MYMHAFFVIVDFSYTHYICFSPINNIINRMKAKLCYIAILNRIYYNKATILFQYTQTIIAFKIILPARTHELIHIDVSSITPYLEFDYILLCTV